MGTFATIIVTIIIFIVVVIIGYFAVIALILGSITTAITDTANDISSIDYTKTINTSLTAIAATATSQTIPVYTITTYPQSHIELSVVGEGIAITGPNATYISNDTLINSIVNLGLNNAYYALLASYGTDSNALLMTGPKLLNIRTIYPTDHEIFLNAAGPTSTGNLVIPVPTQKYSVQVSAVGTKMFSSYVTAFPDVKFWIESNGISIKIIRTDKYEPWNQSYTININNITDASSVTKVFPIFIPSNTLPVYSFYMPYWGKDILINNNIIFTPKGIKIRINYNKTTNVATIVNEEIGIVGWEDFYLMDRVRTATTP